MPHRGRDDLPCGHCGRKENHHTVHTWKRIADSQIWEGYQQSFTTCPGFEKLICRRSKDSTMVFVGQERRIKAIVIQRVTEMLGNMQLALQKVSGSTYLGENRRRSARN